MLGVGNQRRHESVSSELLRGGRSGRCGGEMQGAVDVSRCDAPVSSSSQCGVYHGLGGNAWQSVGLQVC